jgi:hypothetical protein
MAVWVSVDGTIFYRKRRSCLGRFPVRLTTGQSALAKQNVWPNSERERSIQADMKVYILRGHRAFTMFAPERVFSSDYSNTVTDGRTPGDQEFIVIMKFRVTWKTEISIGWKYSIDCSIRFEVWKFTHDQWARWYIPLMPDWLLSHSVIIFCYMNNENLKLSRYRHAGAKRETGIPPHFWPRH